MGCSGVPYGRQAEMSVEPPPTLTLLLESNLEFRRPREKRADWSSGALNGSCYVTKAHGSIPLIALQSDPNAKRACGFVLADFRLPTEFATRRARRDCRSAS